MPFAGVRGEWRRDIFRYFTAARSSVSSLCAVKNGSGLSFPERRPSVPPERRPSGPPGRCPSVLPLR
eukprot:10353222-Lingulodinium_polyedra.AAC.1